MNRMLKAVAALALSASLMAGSVLAAGATFQDVPANHWAYSYVQKATQAGLISGKGNGTYGVDDKLSIDEFATMLCGLLDLDAVVAAYQGQSAYWWYPYVEAAYQAGLLTGTTAGNRRAADGRWTATVVEADMNRYDMAQAIANVTADKGWADASGEGYLLAMLMIPDWSSIPTEYQTAVALCYANGFITGMEDGSFAGDKSMTRGQAAVVLCALLEAKNEVRAPSYSNPNGWLVNGDEATETNVQDALDDLKYEFGNYDTWDLDQVYTSDELGSGTDSRGFAYMLSDRIFGAADVTTEDDPSYVKPGDVIYLDDDNRYGVVTEVDGDDFEYVYCDSMGIISWYGSGNLDDLDRYDTVYTRYEGEGSYGADIDEDEVADLIDDFLRYEYDEGDTCDECEDGYRSPEFSNSTVYGDRAFAYYMSDYIFDDREVDSYDGDELDVDEIRLGDVIYLDDEGLYVVVTDVDTRNDEITYLYTSDSGRVYSDYVDYDDLDQDDTIYTRYEGGSSSNSGSNHSGDLDENDVADLIDDFLKDEYAINDVCDECTDGYKSAEFYNSKVYDDRAFAYYLSDYIFDDREVEQYDGDELDLDEIRLGDVIYLDDEDLYVVVTEVDTRYDEITYLYTNTSDKVRSGSIDYDELDYYDTIYTRYEDSPSGSGSSSSRLTESDVEDLIDDFLKDEYGINSTCYECDDGYRSRQFSNSTVYDDRAFAYYMSDYIFDDREVDTYDGDKLDLDDIRLGDVIYLDDKDLYVVVTEVDTRSREIDYLYTNNSGKVKSGSFDYSDLDYYDTLYTRY